MTVINIAEAAAAMGRKGGKSRSESKLAAVRENGQLGGRPPEVDAKYGKYTNRAYLRKHGWTDNAMQHFLGEPAKRVAHTSYYLKDRVAQVEASPQWKSFLEDGQLPAKGPNFNPTYMSKGQLKERGWTEKSIELFLGEHDLTRENPMYKSAAPMKLYAQPRVEKAEGTEEFKTFAEKSAKRKITARMAAPKATRTKTEALLKEVEEWVISVPELKYQHVLKRAIESYNDFHAFEDTFATLKDDQDFLNRITVNYIRHELSDYDAGLMNLWRRVGKGEAYMLLNKKIYEAIAKKYPELKQECTKQMDLKRQR